MDLLTEYTDNYLETVFYFCLKRTGNVHDAQDLSQDISECILEQFDRGVKPISMSAWVWRIARNRYSHWVKEKQTRQEHECSKELGTLSFASREPTDSHKQMQITALRRELAFIRSEYRDLLVAYYIDDRKLSDIAHSLNQNESAVRTRLFRARQKLKEGMKMARTFGKRSYHPEDINLFWSGSGQGSAQSAANDMIAKNLLLEASNNPSTVEDLSIELGIALPYIEDKVEQLCKLTLLRKLDDGRYVTNFFIADRDCINAMRAAKQINRAQRSALSVKIARECMSDIRSLGVYPKNKSDERLLPITILLLVEELNHAVGENIGCPPERENGEHWGVIGYEKAEREENYGRLGTELNGRGNADGMLWCFGSVPLDGGAEFFPGIAKVITNNAPDKFDATQSAIIDECKKLGILTSYDMTYTESNCSNINVSIAIPTFRAQKLAQTREIFRSHPEYGNLNEMYKHTIEAIKNVLKENSHEILHTQSGYCASMEMCALRSYTLHDAEQSGDIASDWTPIPDTMYLILN